MVEYIGNGEVAFVCCHLRVEQDLEHEVAQLFGQVRKVSPLNGVEDLVGFSSVYLRMLSKDCSWSQGIHRERGGAP